MFGTKILEEKKSKFNGNLRVVKTWGMGTYIQANGLTQSGGIVESIWKQTINKVNRSPFTVHRSLILGLGGGTVAKLVRKNWPEAKITGVDIDPEIVELGVKYLELNKDDVDIVIGDALDFTKTFVKFHPAGGIYDLIIVDLYHGDKFPTGFETENYIQLVRRNLAWSGIAVFNRLYFREKKVEAERFGKKLKKVFKNIESFRPVSNIMYICTN